MKSCVFSDRWCERARVPTTSSPGLAAKSLSPIVPGGPESASKIGERVRSSFEFAGATVAAHAVGATVSIGAAIAYEPVTALDSLLTRADAALYRAKYAGRNRVHVAEEEMANERARLIAAARRAKPASAEPFARWSRGKEAF